MDQIYNKIRCYYKDNNIDDSHGFSHAIEVEHISLNIANILDMIYNKEILLKIRLVSLLHDIDDSKYANEDRIMTKIDEYTNTYKSFIPNEMIVKYYNTIQLLTECSYEFKFISEILMMIDIISVSTNPDHRWIPTTNFELKDYINSKYTHKNLNTIDYNSVNIDKLYQIIPRTSDRLASCGIKGIERCIGYSKVLMLKNEKYSREMFSINYVHLKKYEELSKNIYSQEFNDYISCIQIRNFKSVEEVIIERCIKLCYMEKIQYKNIVQYSKYEEIKKIINQIMNETIWWLNKYKTDSMEL